MTLLVDPVKDNDQDQNPVVSQAPAQAEDTGFAIPDKFKGKSAEEIAKSYVELEKEFGRVRNDVGEYRTLTDRLLQLEEKRVRDLEGAGGKVREEEFNIDPAELLANPRESLSKWYEFQKKQDPEYTSLQQRLDRIEGVVVQKEVDSRHSDAAEITNSPEFLEFVKGHPVRLSIAQAAVQNRDVQALDYLLTEYKERKGVPSNEPERKQGSEIDAARAVATEKASSGSSPSGAKGNGKVYSRRKLIDLKIRNPEEYAAMQDEILLAYAQGRVVD